MTADLLVAAFLGVIQGVTEWIPVSSSGLVSAVYASLSSAPLDSAFRLSLWLHAGTTVSAIVAFRRELASMAREAVTKPSRPSPTLRFLVLATAASAPVGLALLITLRNLSHVGGAWMTLLIGTFIVATGAVLLRNPRGGTRTRADVSAVDAVLSGLVQGIAVLPGLSRSGLTVAVLLGRNLDRREALTLSVLMSVPAATAAAVYAGVSGRHFLDPASLVAALIAAITGLAAIRVLMRVAARVNFGVFVLLLGAALIAGGTADLVL